MSETTIRTVAELEESLSRPTTGVRESLQAVDGDVMLLGAGGKLGPTLARMVRRGLDAIGHTSRRVIAVSRFSSNRSADTLRTFGVETVSCDLLDREAIRQLPQVPNILYLVGQKFGTHDSPDRTWMTNTVIPAFVADQFPAARMVVLATGCVYPLVRSDGPGASEAEPLTPPGEYAHSCVGRERVFEFYSRKHGAPMVFVRLCYAIDLRYGVLLDIAQKIARGEPVDVTMGVTNVIWQGDANARIIQCLTRVNVPPAAVNVTGREHLSIRDLATRLGECLGMPVRFTGTEAAEAWMWNAERSYEWFGPPTVSIDTMLKMTADWVRSGGETLNRPTHFEVRDGQF